MHVYGRLGERRVSTECCCERVDKCSSFLYLCVCYDFCGSQRERVSGAGYEAL